MKTQLEDLWTFFRDRDYPAKTLERTRKKLETITREQALTSRPVKDNERDILVSTFFQGLEKPLRNTMDSLWEWMEERFNDHPSWNRFPKKPPMIAWRRNKSLRDKLVSAKFKHTSNVAKPIKEV